MSRWKKRLRGVLGIGSLWGGMGLAVGTIGSAIAVVFGGVPVSIELLEWTLSAAGVGLAVGTGFAGVLTALKGRSTLQQLAPSRVALLGALAGAVMPVAWLGLTALTGGLPAAGAPILSVLAAMSLSLGLLGAGLAAGTVSIAQWSDGKLESGSVEPELLGSNGDT